MNKKVIIMTASTGGGHNRAARAIKEEVEALSNENINIDCEIVDSLKAVNPAFDKIISGGYEKSAKYTPLAYGKMYRLSEKNLISKKEFKNNPLTALMSRKLGAMIRKKRPDLIISTHPFPMIALSQLKKEAIESAELNGGKVKFPTLMTVLTDYTVHSTMVQNEVDYYIVGDEYVKEILVEEGIKDDIIRTYGIPVERSFLTSCGREATLHALDLDPDKFTVLLIGGSFGAGNIKETLDELVGIDRDFQIIVITGRNEALKERLDNRAEYYVTDKNIRILGFVNNMKDILSSIDVLITKPGGLTTTEAILKEVPMIIPYFIPGQEAENLDFFTNCGAALRATYRFSVPVLLKVLFDNPQRLMALKNNIRTIQKRNSSEKIAQLVYEILT